MLNAATFAWRDRAGRFSPLRAATFALVLLPGLWLATLLALGAAGAKPLETGLDVTGIWTLYFLLASLTATPVRRAFGWPGLLRVRRMLGLASLFYALTHLSFYALQENLVLPKIVSEIALRLYLTVGFIAVLGLVALGITSTDRWIKRLGARWRRLHKLAYPILALGLWHFMMQSKLDASEAITLGGFFILLMLYRAIPALGWTLTPLSLAAAALAAIPLTLALEIGWYAASSTLSLHTIWISAIDASYVWPPTWKIALTGIAVAAAAAAGRWAKGLRPVLFVRKAARP